MFSKTPIPCLELPAKCFVSCKSHDLRVSCKPDGGLFSSANYQDWEEWHLIEVGDDDDGTLVILLKSAAHENKYLGSDPQGGVFTVENPGDGESWIIEWSDTHKDFLLKSYTHNRFLVYKKEVGFCTETEVTVEAGVWTLDFTTGELCFVSSPLQDRRISCDTSGNVTTAQDYSGWEVWRFIEAGNDGSVFINSCPNREYFLSSSSDGKIFTTKNREDREKWNVVKSPSGSGVEMISSTHGNRLACDENGLLYTTSDEGPSVVWHLDSAHKSHFFLSSVAHKKRIANGPDKNMIFTTKNRGDWEKWEVMRCGESFVSLRSVSHGVYLACNDTCALMTSSELEEGGLWEIQILSENTVSLQPLKHPGLKLACDKDGRLLTVSETPGDENIIWSFDPCMPEMNQNNMQEHTGEQSTTGKNLAIPWAVFAAAAGAIAMPFAVMGVVSALGFTAGGIASGSIAAGMMSAEAIASGGGVVAGGTVATLQSIGAAGLGIAGTTASASTGAALGAGIAKVAFSRDATKTYAVPAEVKGKEKPSVLSHFYVNMNRPFCTWRSW